MNIVFILFVFGIAEEVLLLNLYLYYVAEIELG